MDVAARSSVGQVRLIGPNPRIVLPVLTVCAILATLGGLMTLAAFSDHVYSLAAANLLMWGIGMAVFGTLFLVGLGLWSVNFRLLVGHGVAGHRDMFRRTHLWAPTEVDRVIDMTISYGHSLQPTLGIYFFGRDGRRLLALNPMAWKRNDLTAFVDAAGVIPESQVLTARQARREFPKALGWRTEHVYIATVAVMLLAVVLAVSGYVLVLALFR
jgi:hypothetical protein